VKYSTSKHDKPKMLLHVCCANCAGYPLELLGKDSDITMFFYNPNIHPIEEYDKRLHDVRKLSEISGIPLIEGPYDSDNWLKQVEGLEDEPEGGKRCSICFDIRMEKTAGMARDKKMDIFATILSISPHKNVAVINRIGKVISEKSGINYYTADLKKKDGFKKANEISRSYGFYRQKYCGCVYSKKV
jgi:predicted adenine nucleotide alpha hydrolase (AANH) superfamily ATPase